MKKSINFVKFLEKDVIIHRKFLQSRGVDGHRIQQLIQRYNGRPINIKHLPRFFQCMKNFNEFSINSDDELSAKKIRFVAQEVKSIVKALSAMYSVIEYEREEEEFFHFRDAIISIARNRE